MLGWGHLHVRRSIGKGRSWQTTTNVVGWPDLELWSERHHCRVYAELKTDAKSSQASEEQLAVLAMMRRVGNRAEVWRPRDLEHVKAVLTDPHGTPELALPNR